ncbi:MULTISPECIES: PH domain-containing protein [unclassified Streptomyces]|uniref:PH domain-containing protein n=1 Tax=unclassified Streptomyces TaxID=2593676 RepID=UPI0004BD0651|nr:MULTISPECIES: PH domain-containing protein [unclassified Streptomyces]
MSSQQPTDEPVYAERVYRSSMGFVSGVLLLALTFWLCGDAVLRGSGSTPWIGLAVALCVVPLIVAFTIRPAVFANEDRMRVRNPFRIIELPWAAVDAVRAGYSAEVLAEGSKYQLWSVPVSLRERKKANRQQMRRRAIDRSDPGSAGDPTARGRASASAAASASEPMRANADRIVDELQGLAELNAARPGAQGSVRVRWSYEIIAPALIGALLLIVLFATR